MKPPALPCASLLLGALLTSPAPAQAQPTSTTHLPLEAILVQAERLKVELERERSLTPGGVSVIDADSLQQRSVVNMADMLRFVPGVFTASHSGNDDIFISSRGSNLDATYYDMNGVKMLQDGLPVTTADGANHNRVIDPLSARYATVARGANALTYGASTLGGSIDLQSATARNSAPMELALNGGSHGQLSARASAGGILERGLDGFITVEARERRGFRQHNRQERHSVYANIGWQPSASVENRTYLTYVHNDQELAGALTPQQYRDDPWQAGSDNISGHFQVNVDTRRIAHRTRWQIDAASTLEAGVYFENQRLYHPIVDKVMVDFDGPGPAQPVEVFSLLINTDHKDYGGSLRYQRQAGTHDVIAGLHYATHRERGGNYRNDSGRRNGITERIDNRADNLEAYLVDRWRLAPRWTLVYGTQLVHTQRQLDVVTVATGDGRQPEQDYTSLNPRLGVLHHLTPDIDLYASLSRLYEAPTNYQLQDDARGDNRALQAMRGEVLEVGTRGERTLGTGSLWRWDVSLYYSRLRDEILSVDDPQAPGTSLTTNIDRTVHAGVEVLFEAQLALGDTASHLLEPRLNITWNEFTFDDDALYADNTLPAAPRYAVRGELLYRHHRGFVGPRLDLIGQRYADFSNSYRTGGYTLLGARMGFSNAQWDAFVELRNALDRKHIATLYVKDVITADAAFINPGEPRSVYAGLRMRF